MNCPETIDKEHINNLLSFNIVMAIPAAAKCSSTTDCCDSANSDDTTSFECYKNTCCANGNINSCH